jgi:hypothetical protein
MKIKIELLTVRHSTIHSTKTEQKVIADYPDFIFFRNRATLGSEHLVQSRVIIARWE